MTPDESYYERIRDSKEPHLVRRAMVEFFLEHGQNMSYTARMFRSSGPAVAKWVNRHKAQGWPGLADRPRRPHHCPHQPARLTRN